jgi:MULE transposase domain
LYFVILQISKETKTRLTKTSRPGTKDERCPFAFGVYYSKNLKRWFIPKEGNGCCNHYGHIQLAKDEVRISTSNIDPKVLDHVLSQLKLDISVSSIRAMLNLDSGFTLTAQQITSLRNSNVLGIRNSTSTSPAESLMSYLKEAENIRFVALTAKKERGNLVTIRMSKKDKVSIRESAINDNLMLDTEDNPKTYAEIVMKALLLQDEETLLLGVAWVTDEGARYFDLYPEVMGFDVTFGTNKEKRPLARGTIKNNRNKNIPFFNAFLPSCAAWVFNWIFHDAMPKLLSQDSLNKLHLILVDDDHHCNSQIDMARNMNILPNAHYRLCKWHKVSFFINYEMQNFINH